MDIILYSFAKRVNSTAQPTGGITIQCKLKGGCSVLTPALILNLANTKGYNYMYIAEFQRYYWIDSWNINTDMLYEITSHVDVLASYKNDIGNSDLYVTRAQMSNDGYIVDSQYPMSAKIKKQVIYEPCDWDSTNFNVGCYVLGIISGKDASVGSVAYYVLNSTQMNTLMTYLFANVDY